MGHASDHTFTFAGACLCPYNKSHFGHLLLHFILSYRSIPNPAQKQILGRSSRLPYFGPDYDFCRCMALPIELESLLCGHLHVHFVTSYKFIPKLCPKQILGRSSRLPCLVVVVSSDAMQAKSDVSFTSLTHSQGVRRLIFL